MGRQTLKPYSELSPERQQAFDEISSARNVKSDPIGGPFDVWLLSPEIATQIVGLGGMFRFRTSVHRKIIELAILLTGHFWKAQFEWYAHEPMARKAGLADHIIAAIKEGSVPEPMESDESAAYHLCMDLHHSHQVSDKNFQAAVKEFGEQGVAEIVNLIGYYTMVSMTLNTFDVDLPKGASKPF